MVYIVKNGAHRFRTFVQHWTVTAINIRNDYSRGISKSIITGENVLKN